MADELFAQLRPVLASKTAVIAAGLHGSLAAGGPEAVATDADFIVMVGDSGDGFGRDPRAMQRARDLALELGQAVGGTPRKSYVCENESLIGHSILTRESQKLSIHFVGVGFTERCASGLPESRILDCIFSTELAASRVVRLWVQETVPQYDPEARLAAMQHIELAGWFVTQEELAREHVRSARNQFAASRRDRSAPLLRNALVSAATLWLYARNQAVFGSIKRLHADLDRFQRAQVFRDHLRQLLTDPRTPIDEFLSVLDDPENEGPEE